jgi:twinkle protein
MDAAVLKARLAGEALAVCKDLLSEGVLKGHEWCVGGIDNHPGNSLKVVVSGAKAGIWADFGGGGGQIEKGDLLDLWCAVRGCTISQALQEVRERYGIQKPIVRQAVKKKAYDRPRAPEGMKKPAGTPVEIYLKTERGLYPETIKAWQFAQADEYKGVSAKDGQPFVWKGPWILFPFLRPDAEGKNQLINLKWIRIERDKDGKKVTVQAKNAEYCLGGWHLRPKGCRKAIICEGEIDAPTMWQCLKEIGRGNDYTVLTVPAGAGTGDKHSWIENDWERLEEFEQIVLCMDMDEEGDAATLDIASRLGMHRCRRVTLPHKDVNECWAKHGITAAHLVLCIDAAKEMAPDSLKSAADFVEATIEEFYPSKAEAKGIAMPWGRMSWLRFRPGEVTTCTGLTGAGKSALLNQISLCAMDVGTKAMIASMEMRPSQTLERMTRQACREYKPSRDDIRLFHGWLDGRLWIFNVKGQADAKTLFANMLYARRRFGCTFFVIDSLMRCGIKQDDYEAQDQFVKDICAFCEAEYVHVVLIAHMKKLDPSQRGRGGRSDIKGSAGITDNTFNNIIVWRNEKKESAMDAAEQKQGDKRDAALADLREKPDAGITCDKQRNDLGTIGTVPLWYEKRTCLYRDSRDEDPPMLLTFRTPSMNAPTPPHDLEAHWQALEESGDAYQQMV